MRILNIKWLVIKYVVIYITLRRKRPLRDPSVTAFILIA